MPLNHSPYQIQNISQLRSILQQISLQNQHTIKDFLIPFLEDQHYYLTDTQKIANICMEELNKKQQDLNNVLQFSLHLLNELQFKSDCVIKINQRMSKLQSDMDKLLTQNEDLVKKIQLVEDQNYHFKNKIQEAQTYFTQVSQTTQALNKSIIESIPAIQVHSIQISNFSKNYSHLTERPSLTSQNYISNDDYNKKISIFTQNLQQKSCFITDLQQQINNLKTKIVTLENQLNMKSSELELSQLYFKEKLDIMVSQQTINRSHQVSISQIQLHSVFRKQMLRVDSAKSIQSIVNSENSDKSQSNQDKSSFFEVDQLYCRKNSAVRRSLMQDFVTDFAIEAPGSIYSSILDSQQISPNNSCILRQRKKSISVSTADMRKTLNKGVQTSFDPISKIIRKSSNQSFKKEQQHKDKFQSSFLGLGSITSLFSKKKIPNDNQFCSQFQKQSLPKNQQSFLGDSSIGDIFKGIFDYATKKIVTNRIHKKSKTNNMGQNMNQSFISQMNYPQRRKSFIKGMKN